MVYDPQQNRVDQVLSSFSNVRDFPVSKRRWSRTASSAKIEVLSLESEQEGKSWESLLRSALILQRMSSRYACWMCTVQSLSDPFLDATRSSAGQNNCRRAMSPWRRVVRPITGVAGLPRAATSRG